MPRAAARRWRRGARRGFLGSGLPVFGACMRGAIWFGDFFVWDFVVFFSGCDMI